ncbi:MAG TPA: cation:proton antiporter [Candidatus Limnocylindrales bacterium]
MPDLGVLAPIWLVVGILAASVAVALLTRRWALPSSVVLVLVGLAVALVVPSLGSPISPPIQPDLLLAIVLPGLVFEAAFRTDVAVLRPSAAWIVLLGIPGVLVVAVVVAVILAVATGLSAGEAFVVGAMVAATDPAAVLAAFRRLPVPARLATTVEMESLVNDGTGIALFALALGLLSGGGSAGSATLDFVLIVLGSGVIGAAAGFAAGRLVRIVDDHLVELTITIVLAYGTYLLAAALGGSGVIATLVAASIFGAGARRSLTERTRETIDDVWELVAFLLTAGVFLLVGVSIAPGTLVHAAGPIAAGILAVLIARGIVVYGLLGGAARLAAARRPEVAMPIGWLHVLFWAGLRGAVSVALALSLPADLPNRELLQGITFGIVLFTLLVQGTTIGWVVRAAGVSEPADPG